MKIHKKELKNSKIWLNFLYFLPPFCPEFGPFCNFKSLYNLYIPCKLRIWYCFVCETIFSVHLQQIALLLSHFFLLLKLVVAIFSGIKSVLQGQQTKLFDEISIRLFQLADQCPRIANFEKYKIGTHFFFISNSPFRVQPGVAQLLDSNFSKFPLPLSIYYVFKMLFRAKAFFLCNKIFKKLNTL